MEVDTCRLRPHKENKQEDTGNEVVGNDFAGWSDAISDCSKNPTQQTILKKAYDQLHTAPAMLLYKDVASNASEK